MKKRVERWKNVGKTALNVLQISSKARCTCEFIRNKKILKLVGHIKILLSIIAGILDSFLNLSIDYQITFINLFY